MNRKQACRWGLVGLLLAGLLLYLLWIPWHIRTASVFGRFQEKTLIIDPGHGGEDGGAISISGKVESQVNLAIALQLDSLMGFYGVHTVMTRDTDRAIYDSDAETLRQKKVSDLRNRVALINEVPNATLISIHQNSYTSQRYRGMQVFYANGELSLPLAKTIQDMVRVSLDPENTRTPQKIPSSVYLMNHVSCRAILVECGFLSNPMEDQLLQERDYQLKVAMTLAAGYICYEDTQERESLI